MKEDAKPLYEAKDFHVVNTKTGKSWFVGSGCMCGHDEWCQSCSPDALRATTKRVAKILNDINN